MRRAAWLALAAMTSLPAWGQVTGGPEFDVATVRLSPPPTGDTININLGTIQNGRLALTNVSLSDCIKFAYGIVSDDQLMGPDWIKSRQVSFDIVAQAPADTSREEVLRMLQALLADRLKLALHHEQKQLSYLGLIAGKNRPKIHQAKADAPLGNLATRGRIVANQMPMNGLATLLSRFERETVVDQTGLSGRFEFKLEWTPEGAAAAQDGAAAPSLFTAVQEQLGLKLERRKGPLDVLVVDSADQVPAAN